QAAQGAVARLWFLSRGVTPESEKGRPKAEHCGGRKSSNLRKGITMKKYSPYFTTLYDQQAPVGKLGRGTHYSILRATCWDLLEDYSRTRAKHFDFAILWDEDHDTRIIQCIEELYLEGLLPRFIAFGERKGILH